MILTRTAGFSSQKTAQPSLSPKLSVTRYPPPESSATKRGGATGSEPFVLTKSTSWPLRKNSNKSMTFWRSTGPPALLLKIWMKKRWTRWSKPLKSLPSSSARLWRLRRKEKSDFGCYFYESDRLQSITSLRTAKKIPAICVLHFS